MKNYIVCDNTVIHKREKQRVNFLSDWALTLIPITKYSKKKFVCKQAKID
jgi:hypothetical protein